MSLTVDPAEMTVLQSRDYVQDALRREVLGPDPRGESIQIYDEIIFDSREQAGGPWVEEGTGEEILTRDPPLRRYGVGILFPQAALTMDESILETYAGSAGVDSEVDDSKGDGATVTFRDQLEASVDSVSTSLEGTDTGEYELSNANAERPSAMAVTCLVDNWMAASVTLEYRGGRYELRRVKIGDAHRMWWVRRPVVLHASVNLGSLGPGRHRLPVDVSGANTGSLVVEPFVMIREAHEGRCLATFGVVNRTKSAAFPSQSLFNFENSCSLFQSEFTVAIVASDGSGVILPYADARPDTVNIELDDEERSIELLYRRFQSFGVGHGCAADWDVEEGAGVAAKIRATPLPVFETPSITPSIIKEDGESLQVFMGDLAGLNETWDGYQELDTVIAMYGDWIDDLRMKARELEPEYTETARRHIADCESMLERMRSGLAFLRSDATGQEAFRLANLAVLLQQIRAGSPERKATLDAKAETITFSAPPRNFDPRNPGDRGRWRPFQIAFLLASVESTVNRRHPDRELVDLIFFPTGGGKTEAYLGLAAFAIFHRRLVDPTDAGTEVLMRYTLRLLTAQQFQRASALVCAMETIRRERSDLGKVPFRIGIWVGGDTTPNRREDARKALTELKRERYARNPFIVIRCPWCAAQMGPLETPGKGRSGGAQTVGYVAEGKAVAFKCPDRTCPFHDWGLPVLVVDEDLYDLRPDFVIGTIDKFAQLTWNAAPRAMFGIGGDGSRIASPPSLIIQDELHLISGPLGTIAGLYEGVIEDLCSLEVTGGEPLRPKIVSSTATIRSFEDQVRSLFARQRTSLFPPRGLDISDSFFARYDRENGALRPGRRYVGVLWQGLGSTQTSMVRSFTALLQAPVDLVEPRLQDPWWTPVIFFGSLRELGGALSLFQSDIPDYLKTVKNRTGRSWDKVRRLREPLELTGRLSSDEVPRAMAQLEATVGGDANVIDVCLASNIIEVGIDIDRLSLMAIVSQPKSTAQYIQVSGRVGRRVQERPGLIVTIYSPTRPRDRSHFERFRSYHERMYGQVEPTSVTPFSPHAMERALHAALVAYVRSRGGASVIDSPHPVPEALLKRAGEILRRRVEIADPDELKEFDIMLERRIAEWRRWERLKWDSRSVHEGFLLRPAGAFVERSEQRTSWPTPTSMRNVDAECQLEIGLLDVSDELTGEVN